jgi:hypothetical protein
MSRLTGCPVLGIIVSLVELAPLLQEENLSALVEYITAMVLVILPQPPVGSDAGHLSAPVAPAVVSIVQQETQTFPWHVIAEGFDRDNTRSPR